jgi:RND superfamily putative drug exporter
MLRLTRGDATAAVREGVASTGRVITAAAAVMVAVFISFATGDERALKLFGVALATAVFLDAIVIRSILMPAVLELFGRRTWAFPRSFDRRLPRLAIEPAVEPRAGARSVMADHADRRLRPQTRRAAHRPQLLAR